MNRAFYQPKTLVEALTYRRDEEESALLAGGTDLIIELRKDMTAGSLIDLSKVEELKGICMRGDEIRIGAMATFATIADAQLLREKAGVLCMAAKSVGAPQIRNRGTVGGNVCNASPAADSVPVLVCLGAKAELQSLRAGCIQTRYVNIEDLIVGNHCTALEKQEILTSVVFKVPPQDTKMNFEKIGRRNALAVARMNGACLLRIDGDIVSSARVSIGSVMARPGRFSAVEEYLIGKQLSEDVLREAGRLAAAHVQRQVGARSSSQYKIPVIARFTAMLIANAFEGKGSM